MKEGGHSHFSLCDLSHIVAHVERGIRSRSFRAFIGGVSGDAKASLPELSVFLFTPAENALCQRVDVGRGYLFGCSLAHERVDRCLRVLPGEPAVLGSADELCDRFSKSRRRMTRAERSREIVRESLLADTHQVGRSRNVM